MGADHHNSAQTA